MQVPGRVGRAECLRAGNTGAVSGHHDQRHGDTPFLRSAAVVGQPADIENVHTAIGHIGNSDDPVPVPLPGVGVARSETSVSNHIPGDGQEDEGSTVSCFVTVNRQNTAHLF